MAKSLTKQQYEAIRSHLGQYVGMEVAHLVTDIRTRKEFFKKDGATIIGVAGDFGLQVMFKNGLKMMSHYENFAFIPNNQ